MSAAPSRSRWLFFGLLGLAVLVLLGSSALSLHTGDRLARSVATVSQTQREIEEINRLWGILGDRDSAVLRYLMTGRDESLQDFRDTLLRMEQGRQRLLAQLGDDPEQRAALEELARLHDERIRRAEELIVFKQQAMDGDLRAAEALDQGMTRTPVTGNAQAMREVLDGMVAREKARLAEQRVEREQMLGQNRLIVLGANGLALLAGVVALLAIRRLQRREEEARHAAREAQQARRIASERQASLELVAHDLRGHFGNLLFASDLVPDAASADTRARLAESLRGSAASGLLFLRAVLDQAAGEAGGDTAAVLDPGAHLQSVLGESAAAAAAKDMRFERRVDPALRLRGQSTALAHVLRNLVSNAVKYAPAGSLIEIEAETLPDRGRLRVLDRGPGVPAAERGALFQRYLPLSPQPTGGEPATGLGLALARQHARAQGGDLRYEDRPGGGACFVLEWPRA